MLRMAAQRLVGPRPASPVEAVRWLTAVQAQDLPGALTSVALRTDGGTRAAVTAALDAGEVVRSRPPRPAPGDPAAPASRAGPRRR